MYPLPATLVHPAAHRYFMLRERRPADHFHDAYQQPVARPAGHFDRCALARLEVPVQALRALTSRHANPRHFDRCALARLVVGWQGALY